MLLPGEWGHVGTWLVLVVMAATVAAVARLAVRGLHEAPAVLG